MIKIANSFDLNSNTLDLIIGDMSDNEIYKQVNMILNNALHTSEKSQIFHTLSLLKNQHVYFYKKESLKSVFTKIASLKGDFVVLLDTFSHESLLESVEMFGELITKQNYYFDDLKSKKEKIEKSFTLVSCSKIALQNALSTGICIGKSINEAKRLVDLPPNYLSAQQLANYVVNQFRNLNHTQVEIYDKAQISSLKMGAFLGVNKGSYEEPKLIVIKYQGKKDFTDPLCLVGKGLTFDSGGYSLKQNMIQMKTDMAGAASVISAVYGMASLRLEENILAVIPATDNRMGEYAIVPDDVLTSMSNKTIEIVSTDAEGRLILADALTFAQKTGAKKIIDLATLTGSIVASLGDCYTGAYTNDLSFYQSLEKVCFAHNEPLWRMPLDDQYFEGLASKVADMKNSGPKVAGASVAAIFLKQFIEEDTKWIHLDIAGTSTKNEQATGVLVKSLIAFVRS